MSSHDPIAYTFEADYHCPPCTFARFGTDENGSVPENAEDSEGNPIGAVFEWDEWFDVGQEGPETLNCGDCRAELAAVESVEFSSPEIARMVDGYESAAEFCSDHLSATEDENGRTIEVDVTGWHADTVAQFESDCEDFAQSNRDTIRAALAASGRSMADIGGDFFFTREGHGTGFWDTGRYPEPFATQLTDAAHAYGPVDLYLGGDGWIYQS